MDGGTEGVVAIVGVEAAAAGTLLEVDPKAGT